MKPILKSALKDAMKAQDKEKMEAIRGLLSAIQYEEMQAGTENLDDATSIAVLKRELKKKHEEIEYATQAARQDTVDRAKKDIVLIESFLPKQMSASDLENHIKGFVGANAGTNMGAVMKFLKEKFDGQYDGKTASEVAKRVMAG